MINIGSFFRPNHSKRAGVYDYKYTERTNKSLKPLIFNNGRSMEFTIFSQTWVRGDSIKFVAEVINPHQNNYLQLDGPPEVLIKRIAISYRSKILEEVHDYDVIEQFTNDMINGDGEELKPDDRLSWGTRNDLIPAASRIGHYLFNPQQTSVDYKVNQVIRNGCISFERCNRKTYKINLRTLMLSKDGLIPMFMFPLGLRVEIELNEYAFFVPVFNGRLQDFTNTALNKSEYNLFRMTMEELEEARKIKKILEADTTSKKPINEAISMYTHKSVTVLGKGNCLYEATALYLNKTVRDAKGIKTEVTKDMVENPEYYVMHIPASIKKQLSDEIRDAGREISDYNAEELVKKYLEAKGKQRGDGAAEIQGIARIFKMPIEVYKIENNEYKLSKTYNFRTEGSPLRLLYNANHYTLLVPKNDDLNISKIGFNVGELINLKVAQQKWYQTRNLANFIPDIPKFFNFRRMISRFVTLGDAFLDMIEETTQVTATDGRQIFLFTDRDNLKRALSEKDVEAMLGLINWDWFQQGGDVLKKFSDLNQKTKRSETRAFLPGDEIFNLSYIRSKIKGGRESISKWIKENKDKDEIKRIFRFNVVDNLNAIISGDIENTNELLKYLNQITTKGQDALDAAMANNPEEFKESIVDNIIEVSDSVFLGEGAYKKMDLRDDIFNTNIESAFLKSASLPKEILSDLIGVKRSLYKPDFFKRLRENYEYNQAIKILKSKFPSLFNYRSDMASIYAAFVKKDYNKLIDLISNTFLIQFKSFDDILNYNPFSLKRKLMRQATNEEEKEMVEEFFKVGVIYSNFGGLKRKQDSVDICNGIAAIMREIRIHPEIFSESEPTYIYENMIGSGLMWLQYSALFKTLVNDEKIEEFTRGKVKKSLIDEGIDKAFTLIFGERKTNKDLEVDAGEGFYNGTKFTYKDEIPRYDGGAKKASILENMGLSWGKPGASYANDVKLMYQKTNEYKAAQENYSVALRKLSSLFKNEEMFSDPAKIQMFEKMATLNGKAPEAFLAIADGITKDSIYAFNTEEKVNALKSFAIASANKVHSDVMASTGTYTSDLTKVFNNLKDELVSKGHTTSSSYTIEDVANAARERFISNLNMIHGLEKGAIGEKKIVEELTNIIFEDKHKFKYTSNNPDIKSVIFGSGKSREEFEKLIKDENFINTDSKEYMEYMSLLNQANERRKDQGKESLFDTITGKIKWYSGFSHPAMASDGKLPSFAQEGANIWKSMFWDEFSPLNVSRYGFSGVTANITGSLTNVRSAMDKLNMTGKLAVAGVLLGVSKGAWGLMSAVTDKVVNVGEKLIGKSKALTVGATALKIAGLGLLMFSSFGFGLYYSLVSMGAGVASEEMQKRMSYAYRGYNKIYANVSERIPSTIEVLVEIASNWSLDTWENTGWIDLYVTRFASLFTIATTIITGGTYMLGAGGVVASVSSALGLGSGLSTALVGNFAIKSAGFQFMANNADLINLYTKSQYTPGQMGVSGLMAMEYYRQGLLDDALIKGTGTGLDKALQEQADIYKDYKDKVISFSKGFKGTAEEKKKKLEEYYDKTYKDLGENGGLAGKMLQKLNDITSKDGFKASNMIPEEWKLAGTDAFKALIPMQAETTMANLYNEDFAKENFKEDKIKRGEHIIKQQILGVKDIFAKEGIIDSTLGEGGLGMDLDSQKDVIETISAAKKRLEEFQSEVTEAASDITEKQKEIKALKELIRSKL